MTQTFHSGFVTIIGRPNVGKSTLMNALVGEKIAIVSPRPQTTRSRIMGIMSEADCQIVFLDTPGLHNPRNRLGEYMMKVAKDSLTSTDALMVLTDISAVSNKDREVIHSMSTFPGKKVLVLNKIDLLPKETLLPLIAEFSKEGYDAILPVSAKSGDGVEQLKKLLISYMPEGPHYFPEDAITDQPQRQICAELIREKALLHLKDEVPHGIGVEMMSIKEVSPSLTEIHATIYCERPTHKGIIIGKQGSMLRLISTEARRDIEKLLDTHVYLQLWVKVREDWRNSPTDLRTLGYSEQE